MARRLQALRLALLASALIGATVLGLSTNASSAPGGKSVKCGGGPTTLLFWPRGHKKIDSVNFPAVPTPHLEAYVGGAAKYKYPSTWWQAYLDSYARSSTSKNCKNTPATAASPGIKNSKRTTSATRLDCDIAAKKTMYTINAAGAADFRVREGSKLVVDVHMAHQGSWMKYDSKMCTPGRSPS
jgi:hypothetical protein